MLVFTSKKKKKGREKTRESIKRIYKPNKETRKQKRKLTSKLSIIFKNFKISPSNIMFSPHKIYHHRKIQPKKNNRKLTIKKYRKAK